MKLLENNIKFFEEFDNILDKLKIFLILLCFKLLFITDKITEKWKKCILFAIIFFCFSELLVFKSPAIIINHVHFYVMGKGM